MGGDDYDDYNCWHQARTEESKAEGEEEPHDTEFLARSHQVHIMIMIMMIYSIYLIYLGYNLNIVQVTAIVRKELAVAIRDLMHHGLNQVRWW